MPQDVAIDLVQGALRQAALLALPVLGVVFAVSLLVSLLQSLTGVQDPSVALVPRLLAGGVAVLCLLPWLTARMVEFTADLYQGVAWGP